MDVNRCQNDNEPMDWLKRSVNFTCLQKMAHFAFTSIAAESTYYPLLKSSILANEAPTGA